MNTTLTPSLLLSLIVCLLPPTAAATVIEFTPRALDVDGDDEHGGMPYDRIEFSVSRNIGDIIFAGSPAALHSNDVDFTIGFTGIDPDGQRQSYVRDQQVSITVNGREFLATISREMLGIIGGEEDRGRIQILEGTLTRINLGREGVLNVEAPSQENNTGDSHVDQIQGAHDIQEIDTREINDHEFDDHEIDEHQHTPEPATLVLLALGAVAMLGYRRLK